MQAEFTFSSFAVRNLKRKPLRTAILIFAISLMVSALVFSFSFVRRVSTSISLTSQRLGADILVVPAGARGFAEDVLLESKVTSFYMSRDIIERVRAVKGVDRLTYQTYLTTMYGLCCGVPETLVVAFNQETDFIIKPWVNQKFGRKLLLGEAFVGCESAMNIRLELVAIDSVLFGNAFKMVGVLDPTGTGLDTALFIDEENLGDIMRKGKTDLRPNQISIIFIKVKERFNANKVAGDIEDTIVEVDTMARKDIGKSIITTLRDINSIFIFTIILICFLTAFLTWAIFSAIANERAREVGIMRAVGAKESHIVTVIFLEIIIIGSIGSLIGIFGGTVLSIMSAKSFSIIKNLPMHLGIAERIVIACIAFIIGNTVCIAGALSPVQKLKRMEPLMAIKKE